MKKWETIHAFQSKEYDEKAQRAFDKTKLEIEILDEELSGLERQEAINLKSISQMSTNTQMKQALDPG